MATNPSCNLELQLVLRPSLIINTMKRARCDREDSQDSFPTTTKKLKMEETTAVILFPQQPVTRSQPPSPLRYQITEPVPTLTVSITPPSTPTKHKHRGRITAPLLKQVLGPVIQPLPEFKYSEKEIEITSLIGMAEHSTIFRIYADGKFYALKIHRYLRESTPDSTTYPFPNPFFEAESAAYARLTGHPSIHGTSTPKCHGYINLTSIPISPEPLHPRLPPRDLFASAKSAPALYLDYITHPTSPRCMLSSPTWQAYFLHAPPGSVILRGLVFEDLPQFRLIHPTAFSTPSKEMRAIAADAAKQLKALHACGVLHGNITEGTSSLLRDPEAAKEGKVMFVGFSRAKTTRDLNPREFRRAAKREVRDWCDRWRL